MIHNLDKAFATYELKKLLSLKMFSAILLVIYIIGLGQGIVLIISLMRKNLWKEQTVKLLFGLILSITVMLFFFLLVQRNLVVLPKILGPLSTASWFATGPLLYLYAKSYKSAAFRLRRWHLLYFMVPAYNLISIILDAFGVHWGFYVLFDTQLLYGYSWLSAYLTHTLLFMIPSVVNLYSKKFKLDWLGVFYQSFFMVLILLVVYLAIVDKTVQNLAYSEQTLALIFGGFVLIVGLRSIRTADSFGINQSTHRYDNSSFSIQVGNTLLRKLNQVMCDQKPFLDKDLKLINLADRVSMKENDLSQLFSQHMKTGFYEYVRDFRLTEVETRLELEEFAHLKISSIAEDSGFRSRAAFYKAFKEKHGMTPKAFVSQRKGLKARA